MPLLRLLHQITNMYQNVKDTQNELREQQPVEIRRPKTSASDHIDIKHHHSSSKPPLNHHSSLTVIQFQTSKNPSSTHPNN